MYTAYEETTQWECEYNVPNHTYYLQKDGKCVGYKKQGTSEIYVFKKPRMFDKRYRQFKKVGVLEKLN